MARYRLRLLLQEFDVPPGETVLGRSPECSVTIDDPLVSREHARIINETTRVLFRDLGSRNGSKVNGERMESNSEVELKDGDRIRIGNQDIVFSLVVAARRPPRPTGSLRNCRQCHTPYLAEAPSCPHCGYVPGAEDTLSGAMPIAQPVNTAIDRNNWSMQLQLELLEKANSLGRTTDADRVLKGIAQIVDDRILAGTAGELDGLEPVFAAALRTAALGGGHAWAGWVLTTLRRLERMPKAPLVAQLTQLPPIIVDEVGPQLEAFVAFWNERSDGLEGQAMHALSSLSRLRDESIARRARHAPPARG
ncbi:MAG: hypothetical protein NVSMB47_08710 [Polyangiales bacterium]